MHINSVNEFAAFERIASIRKFSINSVNTNVNEPLTPPPRPFPLRSAISPIQCIHTIYIFSTQRQNANATMAKTENDTNSIDYNVHKYIVYTVGICMYYSD